LGYLGFVIGFLVLKYAFGILICDDAYITLAHARSWNSGLGPIMSMYNPVCATSTPLHTLVLSVASWVLGVKDYPVLAYFTNVVWDLVGLFFLHRIASRGLAMSQPWVLASVAAYAFSINFLAVSAYGMETPMVVAIALSGSWFAFYSSKPMYGLLAVCFLAPLARPEGALIPASLVLVHLGLGLKSGTEEPLRLWRRAFICAAVSALAFALFFAFYRYAYGQWLPHSVIAKRMELSIGFIEALRSWKLNVFYKGPTTGGVTAVTLVNLLAIGTASLGFWRIRKTSQEQGGIPWELLVWPFGYFLFFMLTRSSYILFTWYYLPVLPFLIVFIFCGIDRVFRGRVNEVTAWILVLGFLVWVPVQTFRQHLPLKHRLTEEAREGRYKEAGHILDSLSGPDQHPWAMIDEVGALGYFSHVRILDSHGLLSPEALPFLGGDPKTYFTRMAAMQDKCDPDWILAMRLLKDEGQWYIGEDALYAGYELKYTLRRPPHGYNFEMWQRTKE
jgi:hypothetical protein